MLWEVPVEEDSSPRAIATPLQQTAAAATSFKPKARAWWNLLTPVVIPTIAPL